MACLIKTESWHCSSLPVTLLLMKIVSTLRPTMSPMKVGGPINQIIRVEMKIVPICTLVETKNHGVASGMILCVQRIKMDVIMLVQFVSSCNKSQTLRLDSFVFSEHFLGPINAELICRDITSSWIYWAKKWAFAKVMKDMQDKLFPLLWFWTCAMYISTSPCYLH